MYVFLALFLHVFSAKPQTYVKIVHLIHPFTIIHASPALIRTVAFVKEPTNALSVGMELLYTIILVFHAQFLHACCVNLLMFVINALLIVPSSTINALPVIYPTVVCAKQSINARTAFSSILSTIIHVFHVILVVALNVLLVTYALPVSFPPHYSAINALVAS